MSCPESWTDKALEALALDELDPAAAEQLRAHAAACHPCHAAYDRVTRVDAFLAGVPGGLSRSRQDALQAQLLARLGKATEAATATAHPSQARPQPAPVEPRAPSFFERFRLVLAPAGLALAALALVVYTQRPEEPGSDGYQSRAGAADVTFGVRAFCVATDGSGQAEILAEAGPGETLRCADGSRLQFTATSPQRARLDLVALPLSGEALHFIKSDEEDAALAQGVDMALPFSTPVSATWLTGPLTVRARFLAADSDAVLGESELVLTPPDRR